MSAGKAYLAEHAIPALFDSVSKQLLRHKPDDPVPFVLELLRRKKAQRDGQARAEDDGEGAPAPPVGARSSSLVKRRPKDFSLEEDSLAAQAHKLDSGSLATRIRQRHNGLKVIDVRDDGCRGGYIRGAELVPYSEFDSRLPALVEDCANEDWVVFACLNGETSSMAASQFSESLTEKYPGSKASTFALLGGVAAWVQGGRENTDLLSNYDEAFWREITSQSSPALQSSPQKKARRAPPSLSVPVHAARIHDEELVASLKANDNSIVVVDVREDDFAGGSITGSINMPQIETSELHEILRRPGLTQMVFVCMNGEVLSTAAATKCMDQFPKDLSLANTGSGGIQIGVLMGGFSHFCWNHHKDTSLITRLDTAMWKKIWQAQGIYTPTQSTSQKKKMNLNLDTTADHTPKMGSDELYEQIKRGDLGRDLAVIDVRGEDYTGGNIRGSINFTHEDIESETRLQDLATRLRGMSKIVLICLNSETHSHDLFTRLRPLVGSSEIYLLKGGFVDFSLHYHYDDDVIESFDRDLWTKNWESQHLEPARDPRA